MKDKGPQTWQSDRQFFTPLILSFLSLTVWLSQWQLWEKPNKSRTMKVWETNFPDNLIIIIIVSQWFSHLSEFWPFFDILAVSDNPEPTPMSRTSVTCEAIYSSKMEWNVYSTFLLWQWIISIILAMTNPQCFGAESLCDDTPFRVLRFAAPTNNVQWPTFHYNLFSRCPWLFVQIIRDIEDIWRQQKVDFVNLTSNSVCFRLNKVIIHI